MMDNLYRDQRKQMKIQAAQANIQRNIIWKEMVQVQERQDDRRDVKWIENIQLEKAVAIRAARELLRKKAIQEQKELETQIAKDMRKHADEALKEEKLRQLLHQNCPEIRELQQQIMEARVAKERSIQLAQKAAVKEQLEHEEKMAREELDKSIQEEERKENDLKKDKLKIMRRYHESLDEQKRQQVVAIERECLDADKEKEMIDAIVRKIHEEDLEEVRQQKETRDEYKKQIEEIQRVNKQLEDEERIKWAEEDTKAAHFRVLQDYRQLELEEKRLTVVVERQMLQEKLFRNLEEIQEVLEKNEILIQRLAAEEKELTTRKNLEILEASRVSIKGALLDIYAKQIWNKEQEKLDKKREDEIYRMVMQDSLRDDIAVEASKKSSKLESQKELKNALLELIEERKRLKLQIKEEDMQTYRKSRETAELRDAMVAEEKRRILEEGIRDLLGFLPKGIFKDQEELDGLSEKFRNFYKRQTDKDTAS